ncbi:MAG: DUF2283 domain-containing protein [Candidatus Brocadiales bacterium]
MDKSKIKAWYDEEVDILYISLKEGVAVDSEETEEGIRVEYGINKEIVGIEITKVSILLAQAISRRIEENLVSLNLK